MRQCRVCLIDNSRWSLFCSENVNIEGHHISFYIASLVIGIDLMEYCRDEDSVICKDCEFDIKALYRFVKHSEKSLEYFKKKEKQLKKAGPSKESSAIPVPDDSTKRLLNDKNALVKNGTSSNSLGTPLKLQKVKKKIVLKAEASLKRPSMPIQNHSKLQKTDKIILNKDQGINNGDDITEPQNCEPDNLLLTVENIKIERVPLEKSKPKRQKKTTELNGDMSLREIMNQSKIDLEDLLKTNINDDSIDIFTGTSSESTQITSGIPSAEKNKKLCYRCGVPLNAHDDETKCKLFGYGFSEHFKYFYDNSLFKCRMCSQLFKTVHSAMSHIDVGTKIPCNLCNDTFVEKKDLEAHKSQYHGADSVVQCKNCHKLFRSIFFFIYHLEDDNQACKDADFERISYPIVCDDCNTVFLKSNSFGNHIDFGMCKEKRIKLLEGQGIMPKCKKRIMVLNKDPNIDLNSVDEEDEPEKQLVAVEAINTSNLKLDSFCSQCGFANCNSRCKPLANGFSTFFNFTEFNYLECKVCKLLFNNLEKARYHVIQAKYRHFCNMCYEGFIYKAEQIYHKTMNHIGEVARKCRSCNICFISKYKFQEHQHINLNCAGSESDILLNPVICINCDAAFADQTSFLSHKGPLCQMARKRLLKKRGNYSSCLSGHKKMLTFLKTNKLYITNQRLYQGNYIIEYLQSSIISKSSEKWPVCNIPNCREDDSESFVCSKCGGCNAGGFADAHDCEQFQMGFLTYFDVVGGGYFKCKHCNKEFANNLDAKKHVLVRERRYEIFCRLCNVGFMDSQELIPHYRLHEYDNPITCVTCGENFISQFKFIAHKKDVKLCRTAKFHYVKFQGCCSICESVFDGDNVRSHTKSDCKMAREKVLKERQSYIKLDSSVCNASRICKTLPTMQYRELDAQSKEPNLKLKRIKIIENNKFNFPSEFENVNERYLHTMTHDDAELKDQLECHHCNKKFKKRKEFKMHLHSIKAGTLSNYTCPKCSFTTTNDDEFINHLEENRHVEEKPKNFEFINENMPTVVIKQEPEVHFSADYDEMFESNEIDPFSIKTEMS